MKFSKFKFKYFFWDRRFEGAGVGARPQFSGGPAGASKMTQPAPLSITILGAPLSQKLREQWVSGQIMETFIPMVASL
jgi:hypothetical protein